jgi:pimeloyl-ACP methyl ester carboxylesterase
VHGYSDYLFNTELAERYNSRGFDFYAIDLRTYGRSLRPHQTPYFALSMDEYFEELDAAIDRIRNRDGHTFLLYNGHSTGGLTGSLYADARRDAGTIDAVFLNLPYFDLNASWLCPGAHVDEGDIPPVDLGDAVGQRGEAFLELAPVVIGGPRVSQRLDHLDLHALRGIRLPTLSTKARRPADLQRVGRC